ncbi:MAG: hypothetical protein EXX96DRAFT_565231 [Benjaminiella poitrasii]|nr:MAG: hypothetical protein EXX96DRAFT_565231 [Benjaminiella poitrasii]
MSVASKKVVICYDQSLVGRKAVEWVNSHGLILPQDELIIVTVINEDISNIDGSAGWQAIASGGIDCAVDFNSTIRRLEEQGREHLVEAIQTFHALGLKQVKAEILRGRAPEKLAKFAKEQKADLVICGSRGLGYLKRKLIGSTSEYLVHHLDCTVMVVRTHPDNANATKA